MKKFLISILLLIISGLAAVYLFRYDIFQYSAESVFRKNLPAYIRVGKIFFDVKNNRLKINDFAIKNPPGYEEKYLAVISEITCKYRKKSSNLLKGIEIISIDVMDPVIYIEKRSDGDINIDHMNMVMSEKQTGNAAATSSIAPADQKSDKPSFMKNIIKKIMPDQKFKISDLISLPDEISINGGSIFFQDKSLDQKIFKATLWKINATLSLNLSEAFTEVTALATKGKGFINKDQNQLLEWEISWDPTKKDLLMSNRFDLGNVDITHFKVYYDNFLPVDILSCDCSGVLIFNFNDGRIGSQNRLLLSNLKFKEKEGGKGNRYWDVSVKDIVKYLRASSGDVLFDFKIKGDIDQPQFYPGDHMKKAIFAMGFDKISGKITDVFGGNKTPEENASTSGGSGGGQGESVRSDGQTDAELVLDAIKELF